MGKRKKVKESKREEEANNYNQQSRDGNSRKTKNFNTNSYFMIASTMCQLVFFVHHYKKI